MALINSIPRGATVVTRTPTILLKVEKDAFKKISGFIHEFEQRKLFKFLRRYVPWFESLTNDQIYAISEHALWREFAPNATIIDEKQRVNQIFIIKAGTCEVYRVLELEVGNQIRKKRVLVGTLSVGHHFNHQLLKDHDNPNGSAFTVVARDEVECATLVAVGDWINYNLSLKPYEYGLLSRNELIKLDTTYLRERKFRKLQTKILESMAKEYAQDPNAKLETISFNENKSLGWKR
ncbi:hypothetical protein BDR26DRAFT_702010 [Obelidium mucronatum]|nr:hypothetical protein BDR26DRAFT_702010 [Obelidium mucronatum]